MTEMNSRHITQTILFDDLDRFLDDLEYLCKDAYSIVSIFERHNTDNRAIVSIIIKLSIISELKFNEEEIKRKLGF